MKSGHYDCFVFTHIPKCGGTSIRKYLNTSGKDSGIPFYQRYIPGNNGIPAIFNYDRIALYQKQLMRRLRLRILALHAPYGIHSDLVGTEIRPFYFTILREPIERILSHYFYFNYSLGKMNMKGIHINDLSKEELCNVLDRISNLSINYISGKGIQGGKVSADTLRVAQEFLINNYHIYGFLDDINLVIQLLKDNGPKWLKFSDYIPQSNVTKWGFTSDIEDWVIELISEYNSLELDFYQFAQRYYYA